MKRQRKTGHVRVGRVGVPLLFLVGLLLPPFVRQVAAGCNAPSGNKCSLQAVTVAVSLSSVCINGQVVFTATPVTDCPPEMFSKTWGGNTGTNASPGNVWTFTTAYTTPGIKTVTLTVTGAEWPGEPPCIAVVSTNVPVVRVELEKCASGFLPQGGTNDNTTTIRAFVTPDTVKGRFKFTLFDVSDEPGYCMNAPTNVLSTGEDSDVWKDVQFPTQTGFTISGSDSNIAETVSNDLHEATVTIKSFDYGAYGKLKAEFTTQDGTLTCLATEFGGTNQHIRLPADTNGNYIADSWKGDYGPGTNCGVSDDLDDQPSGKIGDGHNRYEEWRGFICKGEHLRCDPETRDLFVYDESGLGIGLYMSAGITVHFIDPNEWSGSGSSSSGKRLLNINRETAPSAHQYAVHIVDDAVSPTNGFYLARCVSESDPPVFGSPIYVKKISICSVDALQWYGAFLYSGWLERALAHELGHATGLYHHDINEPDENPWCLMKFDHGTNTWTSTTNFCTTGTNCQSRINVKDP